MKHLKTGLSLFMLFASLVALGCTTQTPAQTHEGYTQLLLSYIGQDVEGLMDAWGNPGRILTAPDGNKVYMYEEIKDPFSYSLLDYPALIDYPPAIQYPEKEGNVTGGYTGREDCVTYFEINSQGKIVKAIWTGDCRAIERR